MLVVGVVEAGVVVARVVKVSRHHVDVDGRRVGLVLVDQVWLVLPERHREEHLRTGFMIDINIDATELIHIKTSTSTISTRGHRFKLQISQLILSLTLQRIISAIKSYTTGINFLILLLPLTPLITSRKHFAL